MARARPGARHAADSSHSTAVGPRVQTKRRARGVRMVAVGATHPRGAGFLAAANFTEAEKGGREGRK